MNARHALALVTLVAPCLGAQEPSKPDTTKVSAFAGVVRDTLARPLRFVTVTAVGAPAPVVTDDSGRFHLDRIPSGEAHITVMRMGYTPIEFEIALPPGKTVVSQLTMRSSITLAGVSVTGERVSAKLTRDGYYDRKRLGNGQFLTPERVDALGAQSSPSRMLRSEFGIRLQCGAAGPCRTDDCFSVFVNGVYASGQLDERVDPREIYAMEMYKRSPPMEFARGNRCGAIVVWTRNYSQ